METILDDLITDSTSKLPIDRPYCLKVLEEILQSETRDYTRYFSSRAAEGSIVEDIAELDAEIFILEKNVKSVLVSNQAAVKLELFSRPEEVATLEEIKDSLEQLWEISNSEKALDNNNNSSGKLNGKEGGNGNGDFSIEEFLEQDEQEESSLIGGNGGMQQRNGTTDKQGQNTDGNDEFHKALRRLRSRVSQRVSSTGLIAANTTTTTSVTSRLYSGSNGLASVLENLPSIIDLMELPSLARICIRTGHYQEAIMLYTHTNTLRLKFPESVIVNKICDSIANEITTTMQTGLVRLLGTNVSVNSMKKILKYLSSIPPFYKQTSLGSGRDTDFEISERRVDDSLLLVFLEMRAKFIENEIMSYSIDKALSTETTTTATSSSSSSLSDSLLEIIIKRQIEVIREHIYMSLNTFIKSNEVNTTELLIPLNESILQRDITTNDGKKLVFHKTPLPTSPPMLQFVNRCLSFLLTKITKEIRQSSTSTMNTDSICLQLVYCSFRLNDLNPNYHNLFLDKILETGLFSVEQVVDGIVKRSELASRFALT